jgi:hypothetical protein
MVAIRIVEVIDEATFGLAPPCADPGFDHRTCDYWEDADRGSKAARAAWLTPFTPAAPGRPSRSENPFAPVERPVFNPFARTDEDPPLAALFRDGPEDAADNPFAPRRETRHPIKADAPRKLQLLGRGLVVFGSYAKTMLVDEAPVAYAQFGPLSAYPRALRLRDLYPQLPESPLPAVITCIATTAEARRLGHALRLIQAVCEDLGTRGFAAVEAYPEVGGRPDSTSAATPEFWIKAGFELAVADERFPVMRRNLT